MKKKITYDELIQEIPNKYILTIITGERLRNLMVHEKKNEHILVTQVLEEVKNGTITYEDE
ncbi:MAG: DNA-directed RNA polymerase subunit omega [Fusobacteria bacterium]|nr:DNA-directed RNA polymerase subunit omega [Fusobacteriota bacterium]